MGDSAQLKHGARFGVRFFDERDDLVGARWWNLTFDAVPRPDRRRLFKVAAVAGGGVLALVAFKLLRDDDDEVESQTDALALQRREGWNVGETTRELIIPHATFVDVENNDAATWRPRLIGLSPLLSPASARLQPYYVPTLFQSLELPASEKLRTALTPMHSPAMEIAYGRGQALAALLDDADNPGDMAVILDLPGPESVAAAAALAERLEPVFTFDNWPHPLGVVPSQQTLAAAAYYLPRFAHAPAARRAGAPPVFVLDDARLTPYRDEASQFDNRYMARLPTADGWKALGVRRVLYVRPESTPFTQELDDLNDDFVALRDAGIDVKMMNLGDLQPAVAPDTTVTRYYWGGGPGTHIFFWPTYGWYQPYRYTWAPAPRARAVPPTFAPPSTRYTPAPRSTIFSSRSVGGLAGIGRQRPSAFGRVSIRTDRATGRLTGVASGRSGSFGRSRSSWSG